MTEQSASSRSAQAFPELGCYGLAGHSGSPRDLVDEVLRAEQLGIGSVFLSERFNTKDTAVLAGAAAEVSSRIGIGTAATNHNTRHPLVTATMASTLHRLSGGRYALGLGRGFGLLFDVMGLPGVTGAQMEDAIGIYRRLWHGESVVGHNGPAGCFPYVNQDASFDEDIPVLMMAVGDHRLILHAARPRSWRPWWRNRPPCDPTAGSTRCPPTPRGWRYDGAGSARDRRTRAAHTELAEPGARRTGR